MSHLAGISAPVESTPPAPPPPAENTHTVQPGENLTAIAAQHGVSTQQILDVNPQVTNPDRIFPGDTLILPPPADTPEGPGIDVSAEPSSETTNRTANPDGSTDTTTSETSVGLGYDLETGDLTLSAGTGFTREVTNARGHGVSFGVSADAQITHSDRTEDGVRTYGIESDVSVSLTAGASSKQAGVEIGRTEGIRASYEVALPAGSHDVDPTSVTPFNPESMPVGSSVTLDGENYTGTEFEASFRNIAVKSSIEEASGVSVAVERTGTDTVKVTSGPTEAITAYNGLGLDLEAFSAYLGRTDELSGATLQTAEFDISTEQGMAAYNDFLATGRLPEANGTGIANVETIQKLDYTSSSGVDIEAGPFSVSLDGGSNTGSTVVTTRADGTATRTDELQYGDNVPLTISRTFDADGNEIVSERSYTFKIDLEQASPGSYQLLNAAMAGDVDAAETGPVGEDTKTVELTLNQSEMWQLRGMVLNSLDTMGYIPVTTQIYESYVNPAIPQDIGDDALRFSIGLIRVNNNFASNPNAMVETFFHLSAQATGDIADGQYASIPGEISVVE